MNLATLPWRPFVTVAALACRDERYLMIEEVVRGEHALNQPAGHLDPGESLLEAVVRETLEETGCQVTPKSLLGIYHWRAPHNGKVFLRFTFEVHVDAHDPQHALDEGIIEARWMSEAEIRASALPLRSPMILRSIEDYRAGLRYPLEMLGVGDIAVTAGEGSTAPAG